MPQASIEFAGAEQAGSLARSIDKYALLPMIAFAFAVIIWPLIIASCDPTDATCLLAPRLEPKIFWPLMAIVTLVLVARNYSRVRLPPNILALLACVAFAGASVAWSFKPESSSIRFAQQTMVILSAVMPTLLVARSVDIMRGLFVCVALGALLNVLFVFGRPPIDTKFATWGYPGYFSGKNYLGEFAAITVLLAIHEMLYPGARRAAGIVVAVVAIGLLALSNSKTSVGLLVLVPVLAGALLAVSRWTSVSPAVFVLAIPLLWYVFSVVTGISLNRVSFMLYGDSTFTGRSIIWDFANLEIAKRPLFGWGYQSFWLVGPDAPSVLDAPGWVKQMPNAHNGYLDVRIEMGYVGLVLLIGFIGATLHAIGRTAENQPARGWVLLSLALLVIIYNFLESLWMRGYEFPWVLFLIVAAEAGRRRYSMPDPIEASLAPAEQRGGPGWVRRVWRAPSMRAASQPRLGP